MSDIGLSEDVKSDDISSSGLSGAQSFSDYSPSGSDGDNYAQATANLIAQPKVGQNRSNIIGTDNYDPQFAAALQISRGLNPGVNTGGLDVPSYLQPQLTGNIASDFRGSYNQEPKYYSPVERFMQTDLADFVQSAPSLTNLIGRGLDSLMGGIDFLNNSKAGKTVEEVAEEQRAKETAELGLTMASSPYFNAPGSEMTPERYGQIQQEKDFDVEETFGNRSLNPEITVNYNNRGGTIEDIISDQRKDPPISDSTGIASLNRPSIAQLAEDRKKQNALNSIFDMLNKNTQNIEIAAGTNAGKTLNTALPERRDLNAFTSPGFLQSSVNPIIKENPMQGPPRPSEIAPPGFVDIVVQEDKTDTFPGTNMSVLGGKDSSAKAYTPLTEAEAQARTDAGISLERIDPSLFQRNLGPMDFTVGGSRVGNILPAADFRVKREPEVTKRVRISDLPRGIQEIVGLRSNLDYSSRAPVSMQDILDGRRAVESGQFPQQEMADFLGGFGRYAK